MSTEPSGEKQAPYADWLGGRHAGWKSLAGHIASKRRDLGLEQAREVLDGYQGLARDVSLARREVPGSRLHRTAEALYSQLHRAINSKPTAPLNDLWQLYTQRLPAAVRTLRGELTVSFALFIAATLVGFAMVSVATETAGWFLSGPMIRKVQNGGLWTDDLLNIMPSSVLAADITMNNITVSFTAFVLGMLYGIGTLYILSLNGLMLGSIFAYTAAYGTALPLFRFVIAHGIVELSVICVASAAGLAIGRALARPGAHGRIASLQAAAGDAGALLAASVPFLIGCGLIEGYISPNEYFNLATRVAVGLAWTVVFLLVLDGRLWGWLAQMRLSDRKRL
ncbi:MAG: stage II sporulation protein M [Pseudomonadota bacterium]